MCNVPTGKKVMERFIHNSWSEIVVLEKYRKSNHNHNGVMVGEFDGTCWDGRTEFFDQRKDNIKFITDWKLFFAWKRKNRPIKYSFDY